MSEQHKSYLRQMLDASINEDDEAAEKAFHAYIVDKSKQVMEMDSKPAAGNTKGDPKDAKGDTGVKASVRDAKEIKAGGESKADPKAAKGDAMVKATVKRAKEIKAGGESKSDPKAAKGDAMVKATVKRAKEIK